MANRIKNGTRYSPQAKRGMRVKGSAAVRTLQALAIKARMEALDKKPAKESA